MLSVQHFHHLDCWWFALVLIHYTWWFFKFLAISFFSCLIIDIDLPMNSYDAFCKTYTCTPTTNSSLHLKIYMEVKYMAHEPFVKCNKSESYLRPRLCSFIMMADVNCKPSWPKIIKNLRKSYWNSLHRLLPTTYFFVNTFNHKSNTRFNISRW